MHAMKAKQKHCFWEFEKKILAAYALILWLSLESQKHVHGQATSFRTIVWFVPPDNVIVFTSCKQ